VEIWINPACSKCRAATELLDAAGARYTVRRYLDDPPTADELDAVLTRLGLEPWDIARDKEAREEGIDLPRTSSQQATAGRPVASLNDARPGDLVFFDYSTGRAGVDHVGVYIGNGKMIAAPQEGESVKVQDVGNPTVIRRVLPQQAPTAAASSPGAALAGVPYSDLFSRAASRYGVDASLLAAMANQESGFDSQAVSPAGAQGLMQFMPATAKGLGVNPLDPNSAIDGAARYLSSLTKQFGSTDLALAAYNAGPGTVSRYGGIPPYTETQNYVRSVMSKAEAYR